MEIGPITRPSPSNVGPVSRVTLAPTAPVRVDMPKIAVDEAPKPPKPRSDPQPKAQAERAEEPAAEKRRQADAESKADSVDRRITIDAATQQVIYQTIDKDTGEVVRQIPEETMIRLQVYARAMRQGEDKPENEVRLTA